MPRCGDTLPVAGSRSELCTLRLDSLFSLSLPSAACLAECLNIILAVGYQQALNQPSTVCPLQWGPLDFHKQSLRNLQKAMHKTRKLCAIMVDTVGRELLIDSEAKLDEQGWPRHEQKLSIKSGDKASKKIC